MITISSLSLRNVRCFAESQKCELGKVTLLVGENNTGKSTFLGCYAAFAGLAGFVNLTDYTALQFSRFDEFHHSTGEFGIIARDDADMFALDGEIDGGLHRRIQFIFSARQGRPSERIVEIYFRDRGLGSRLLIRRNPSQIESWQFITDDFNLKVPGTAFSYREISTWLSSVRGGKLPFGGDPSLYGKRFGLDMDRQAQFGQLMNFLRFMPFNDVGIAVESVSPNLRSNIRLHGYQRDPLNIANNENLRKTVSEIGRCLGLFEDVANQGHGLRIMQSRQWRTLDEVGLGVHTVLPVLSMMSANARTTTFLLQHPEVQLHPSAQAALAQVMSESQHQFVIETHSDHLIDRFRICVREGVLAPEDLKIVYFARDPESAEAVMHNMAVDRAGNLLDAPGGYRDFFAAETKRLLGFE